MNPRTTAILAVLALVLGAFVYFHEIGGEAERKAAQENEERIHPGLDQDDVEAIELTTRDGIAARFERHDGSWALVSPVEGPADSVALDAMAHALTTLQRMGSVAEPGDLAQYGLDEGARIVRFEIGGTSRGLRIGGPTPVGGHTYVARLADDDVGYVETYRINAFDRNLDDLRERRIFRFAEGDVRTLRVSWHEGDHEVEVALARDERGEWQMGAPLVTRADQRTVHDLLSDLAFLRAKGFVDERTPAIEAALADPLLRISWTLEGDHLERSAKIAGPFEDALLVEAEDGRVFRIDVERRDDWKTRINDYRDKMLSEFDVSSARRIVLGFADEDARSTRHLTAGLAESGWTSETPDVDPDRISELVREFASLRAEDIVADEMGPDELGSLGLAPPRVEVRIEGEAMEDGSRPLLANVEIGNAVEGRGLFARRGDESTVYVLPQSMADRIPISEEALMRQPETPPAAEGDPGKGPSDGPGADPLEGVEIP
ncbi:MAG TPA: DUF4340 domain-containing protein [Deltaproteobacteria bacterium]|nr:DUF4340 domain-containing protein [Deltaproteobacteria bacterium]